MKIGLYSDVHFSSYSSIVRRVEGEFTTRLNNCIKSVNWAEQLFDNVGCDRVICCGDFFDSSTLDSKTITALTKVQWSTAHHTMLVGNHEMGRNDLSISSAHIFEELGFCVCTVPKYQQIDVSTEICFLPYILESERKKSLEQYFSKTSKKRIIISHNDIKGVQMGYWLSETGFEIKDIQDNCDLFINGHIHNGTKVADKVINIGNLTGQNFSEDASKYEHCVFVLDTDTLKIDVYENPYAFNFYKLDSTDESIPWELKPNAVVSVKVNESDLASMKQAYTERFDIVESRFIIQPNIREVKEEEVKQNFSMNHLEEFRKFMLSTEENQTVVMLKELQEVLNEVAE